MKNLILFSLLLLSFNSFADNPIVVGDGGVVIGSVGSSERINLAAPRVQLDSSFFNKQKVKDTVFITSIAGNSDSYFFSVIDLENRLKQKAIATLRSQCLKAQSFESCEKLKFATLEIAHSPSEWCFNIPKVKGDCVHSEIVMKAHIQGKKKIKNVLKERVLDVELSECTEVRFQGATERTFMQVAPKFSVEKEFVAVENPQIIKIDEDEYENSKYILHNVQDPDRFNLEMLSFVESRFNRQPYIIADSVDIEGSEWTNTSKKLRYDSDLLGFILSSKRLEDNEDRSSVCDLLRRVAKERVTRAKAIYNGQGPDWLEY